LIETLREGPYNEEANKVKRLCSTKEGIEGQVSLVRPGQIRKGQRRNEAGGISIFDFDPALPYTWWA